MIRILISIATALIPILSFSQFGFSNDFDSLGKYTYPLFGAAPPPVGSNFAPGTLMITGNASGFFVRVKSKLYLVSAFHVFTDCEVYKGFTMNVRNQFIVVSYKDTLNNLKSQHLSLKDYKAKPCRFFYEYPDIDTMDVSMFFKDAKINSIEKFFENKVKKIKVIDSNKFVCYGYPYEKYFEYITKNNSVDKAPFSYFGSRTDPTVGKLQFPKINIDSMYIMISPALFAGTSGSPIFKLLYNRRTKQNYFQFAGVQSGTNSLLNCSFIVKPEELTKIFDQLK